MREGTPDLQVRGVVLRVRSRRRATGAFPLALLSLNTCTAANSSLPGVYARCYFLIFQCMGAGIEGVVLCPERSEGRYIRHSEGCQCNPFFKRACYVQKLRSKLAVWFEVNCT
ncbi:hypothetical protein T040_21935 [Salmonella enterica subsp. enterica serovar Senftenberg]|nr:hypothetical protein [Salmonella enterica]EBR5803887.1 hypothetical protein [Salmonella enterica]EDE1768753.1 hypothetical protein [Salmonella enterica subsp. enterica serovar Senftenberg]EEJ9532922.1 hypothetical protein [Salmonella enterica subsp. enterica serovar Senftenberg]EFH8736800.1 hypothetical protein [Escherichia coli]